MVDTSLQTARPSITLIGAGRVGSTLARALIALGILSTASGAVLRRMLTALAEQVNARLVELDEAPGAADLTLLAVSDDSLADPRARTGRCRCMAAGQMVVH